MLRGKALQCAAVASGALTSFTTGQMMGWVSPSLPDLLKVDSPIPNLTSAQGSWAASMLMVGNLAAVPLVVLYVDCIGRKWSILISTVPIVISWIFISLAVSTSALYSARFLGGIGEFIGKAAMLMYAGEIAESDIRGVLGSFLTFSYNFGLLYEYTLGSVTSYETLAYASAIPPLMLLLTFLYMPESPYNLLQRKRTRDAEAALQRLRRTDDVSVELEEITQIVSTPLGVTDALALLLGSATNRASLYVMIGLFTAIELSGISPISMYAQTIFAQMTVANSSVLPMFIAMSQVIGTFTAMTLISKTGKRPLYLLSTAICTSALLSLSIYYYLADVNKLAPAGVAWCPLVILAIYSAAFPVGFGVIPYIMVGELFPTNVKTVAVCISMMWQPFASVAAVKIFQTLMDHFGLYASFQLFAALCGVCFIVALRYLPETKTYTLSEIQCLRNSNTRI